MLNIKTMQAADPECSKTDFENALLNTAEKDLVLKRSVEKIAMEMTATAATTVAADPVTFKQQLLIPAEYPYSALEFSQNMGSSNTVP